MLQLRYLVCAAVVAAAVPALAQRTPDGQLLMEAVRAGDGAKAMQLLSANPTLVNTRDSKGQTPLLAAIDEDNEDWVGFLIKQGADVNAANRAGDTPLILATRSKSDVMVGWIIEAGARPNVNNKMGETALIIAVQLRNVQAIKRLLAAGADPDKSDYSGHSARDYAKNETRMPIIMQLIETTKPKQ